MNTLIYPKKKIRVSGGAPGKRGRWITVHVERERSLVGCGTEFREIMEGFLDIHEQEKAVVAVATMDEGLKKLKEKYS